MPKNIDYFMPNVGSVCFDNMEITRFRESSTTLHVTVKVKGASISSTFIPETEEFSNICEEFYDVQEGEEESVSDELFNFLYNDALDYIKRDLYNETT